jgi:hypothetical protein
LIDLPHDSAIVAGLDTWPRESDLQQIVEPRLTRKLQMMTGVAGARIYAPPPEPSGPQEPNLGIGAYRFPEWYVVQERGDGDRRERSRRLVHRKALDDRGRFDGMAVVPTRFVRACPRGHIDDIDWERYVHRDGPKCPRQLWLDERGTSGDLRDLVVRCECGRTPRGLYEAAMPEVAALGTCSGARPWLGRYANESCKIPARLLVRTASNAYFPQVVSVLSLPDRGTKVEQVVRSWWRDLQIVEEVGDLRIVKRQPQVAAALEPFQDEEVFAAIDREKNGCGDDRPVKQVELEAILAAPEGYGDDVPLDPDFHARRLPARSWRKSKLCDPIVGIVQLHRLREVLALTGFTRFEAQVADIHGEFETDVQRAQIALEPKWFPAVENRGEGVFLQFDPSAIAAWRKRKGVEKRLESLSAGHALWNDDRKSKRGFPDGPYVLLHTLSHLLIQSLAMRCGYPATSIRERIYAEEGDKGGFGILLYTGTPDAEGTLGGLVQEARHIESHLETALRMGALCSNDPICSHHSPGESLEGRWLHGAACHGCVLVAETSCEMRNDYLDRALVVPALGVEDAAFFGAGE